MAAFDIIEYLSGLTGYLFDKSVLNRIALERGVSEVANYNDLTQEQKDLCFADELYVIYTAPNSSSSYSASHGTFKKSVGSQTINDKKGIYNIMVSIYSKYSDPKLADVESGEGGLSWLTGDEDICEL